MLIKPADDKSKDIEALTNLAARPDASADVRKKIEQEIRNIRSGMKGEAEAAYEMEFHYGASKNWMIVHDLRLECDGRVAQIDHLLLNRWLEIYVCESKRFSEGVAINEQGEFSAFYGSKPHGIPSPLEQNRRHMAVLEAIFRSGQVPPPRRLGLTLMPSLMGLVLVSKTARISRPNAKIKGIDQVIKNDQLKARIDRDIDSANNPLLAVKIISQDTLADFGRRLCAAHKPVSFDWPAKFGLPATPLPASMKPVSKAASAAVQEESPVNMAAVGEEIVTEQSEGKKSKLVCCSCAAVVTYAVAKFCWFNKVRFGGNVFCMSCQKNAPKSA